jgi:hypothetical protein
MKNRSSILIALAVSSMGIAIGAPTATAAISNPCPLPAPPEPCRKGRNNQAYTSGLYTGESLVIQIWKSAAVGQDPNKWGVLKTAVETTIPPIITKFASQAPDDWAWCRTQGLAEGVVHEMCVLDPIPECQLDGAFWGNVSAELYCLFSVSDRGLGDIPSWFTRPSGMCAENFQNVCDAVFKYGADRSTYHLDPILESFLKLEGYDPISVLWQPAECVPYTRNASSIDGGVSSIDGGVSSTDGGVPGQYLQTFLDAVAVDCSYEIPTPPPQP